MSCRACMMLFRRVLGTDQCCRPMAETELALHQQHPASRPGGGEHCFAHQWLRGEESIKILQDRIVQGGGHGWPLETLRVSRIYEQIWGPVACMPGCLHGCSSMHGLSRT